jgi:type VI secretion system protein ImpA
MASTGVLRLAELIAPLPSGDGGDVRAYRELVGDFKSYIRQEDPNLFPPGDPRRENPKIADWHRVASEAQHALQERAKDVRLAAWLTAACIATDGFAGLSDGLCLLTALVSECWDRILPPFEAHNPGARGQHMATILEEDGDLRVPGRVRMIPLVHGARQGYGSYHLAAPQDDGELVDHDDLQRAKQNLSLPDCLRLEEDIDQALANLDRLRQALAETVEKAMAEAIQNAADMATRQALAAQQRIGPPAFAELRGALRSCQADVKILRDRLTPTQGNTSRPNLVASVPIHSNGDVGGVPMDLNSVAAERARIYQQLEDAARCLDVLQPNTAFPDMIRKVVRWSKLSYRQLHEAKILEVLTQVVTHPDMPE